MDCTCPGLVQIFVLSRLATVSETSSPLQRLLKSRFCCLCLLDMGGSKRRCISSQKLPLKRDSFYGKGPVVLVGLNLTRYVSEATQALAEAKLKISDIGTAMDVCRLIHRRYPDFSVSMLDSWKRVLPLQKGDLVGNPSKIRVDLRFLPDQILTGLLPMKQSLATLTSLLQTLVDSDKEDRIMLPLITAFAKSFAYEFLGRSSFRCS